MNALATVPAGRRILDAGAGEQRYRQACSHLEYVAQDFGEYDPTAAHVGLSEARWDYGQLDIRSDIAAIPQPDASFDVVLCTEVLEHVPDPYAAIREFARLLKSGGELILTAPFGSLTHQAPYHFVTGFSSFWYEHHLVAAGFRIAEISPNGNYFDVLAQEVRRVRSVARRYGHRRMSPLDGLAALQMLRMLARFSRNGQSSAELGTFGFHVRALRV